MFKIGQKVVCVKTHSQGIVKKGNFYTIYNINNPGCCGKIFVDVGIKMDEDKTLMCSTCRSEIHTKEIHWISSALFSPLEHDFTEEVLKKALQQINEELVPIFN
jgi:hypothetical protein